jgi:nuclear pore complex protein Nup98-Nup96
VLRAGTHPDPAESSRLNALAKALPRLLQLLPALFPDKRDVQQIAVLSDMLSALHDIAGQLHLAGYVSADVASFGRGSQMNGC